MKDQKWMDSGRLGRIVEGAASEVYLFSAEDFTFSLVNRGARDNIGYSMDELRRMTPWDIKPELTKDAFLQLVAPLLDGTESELKFETRHQRKDGSTYDVWVHLQLIAADGEKTFYAAIQDVTHQNEIAAELKQVSARFDAILSNTTMAIFMMDDRQQCVFMNKAAEDMSGYTFEETRGRALHDVVHHTYPDGRPFPIEECAIDRAFPENNQTQGEETFVHKDGSFYPVAFTASPMKNAQGKTVGTVIEVREISEEVKARRAEAEFNTALQARVEEAMAERDRLETQLVQAQKMEAVGQLTGGIAHDFNNLLQVVGSNLQLLRKDLAAADPKAKFVDNAMAGVSRGAELTAQLLAFGRKQPLEPRPKNIGRLLMGMSNMLQRALGEAVAVDMKIEEGLWNCFADPTQVENVILNLAINARDAMQHHGKLSLEVANAELDAAFVKTRPHLDPGEYVMLAMRDTGGGIPADVLDKVFDPFFTTKPPGEGTGLGLSMVYGFVKQSGGHIDIFSEEGVGTTVRVYLPRSLAEEEADPAHESGETPRGNGEVVLVVEDDAAVRETAVDLLRDLNYAVLSADNADSAWAIVKSGMQVDVLFTDVVMPGDLRSPDLARMAKEHLPDLVVLFTSGYPQGAIMHAGALDKNVDLLSKPYSRERLANKLHDVMRRGPGRQGRHAATAPTAPRPVAPDTAADTGPDAATGRPDNGRVLLVEDDVLIRMSTADMLAELGYEVVEAGSIAEATQVLETGQFSFMITDLGLPDGEGMDLVRKVRDERPGIRVIVASGQDPRDYADDASGTQFTSLVKPYDERALQQALKTS